VALGGDNWYLSFFECDASNKIHWNTIKIRLADPNGKSNVSNGSKNYGIIANHSNDAPHEIKVLLVGESKHKIETTKPIV
jgi:hypothetical protein